MLLFAFPFDLLYSSTMAALSVAIIGKNQEPLYLKGVMASSDDNDDDEALLLGLSTSSTESNNRRIPPQHEFLFHAALEEFESRAGPPPGLQWRTSNNNNNSMMYAGCLASVEDARVYGYMTTTKILLLVLFSEAVFGPSTSNKPSEADVAALLQELHGLYIGYSLNPFATTTPIVSQRLDGQVEQLLTKFNQGHPLPATVGRNTSSRPVD